MSAMSAMVDSGSDARPDPAANIGTLAAAALPLIFYIAALPAFAYFGSHARLLEEALSLGHAATPAASLLSALAVRVPLGPLALRVGFAGALCAAIGSGALFMALLRGLRALGVQRDEVTAPLCLGACCVAFGSEPLWSLVLRGSPHVLGVALCCLLAERLLCIALAEDGRRDAWMSTSLFAGLLLSHDARWGLATLPALWLAARARMPPRMAVVGLLVGAAPMLHPLLRGVADLAPMPTAAADATLTALHMALAVAAAAGLIACLRTPRLAAPVVQLMLLLGGPALLSLGTGAAAELAHAAQALLLLLAVALTTLGAASVLAAPTDAGLPRLALVVALAWLALGVVQLRHASTALSLADFDTSDVLQQHAAQHLPPRTVVLWPDAAGHANAAAHQRESATRPDVVHVPMSHARDPRASVALSERTPELRALLRDQLLQGRLRTPALQTLAVRTPVALDARPRELPLLCETLLPSGGLLHVIADGATRRDQRLAAEGQAAYYARLYENIEPHRLDDPSRRLLLRLHRRDALYYMHFGDRAAAHAALQYAIRLSPDDADTAQMLAALGEVDGPQWSKPVDIAKLVEEL